MAWAGEQPGMAGLKSALSAAAKTTPPITMVLPTHNTTESSFTVNPPGQVTACGTLQSQDQNLYRVVSGVGIASPTSGTSTFLPSLRVWPSLRPWPLACSKHKHGDPEIAAGLVGKVNIYSGTMILQARESVNCHNWLLVSTISCVTHGV